MALDPIEQDNIAELAEHLYGYLPGSPAWGTTYTFFSAAQEMHLEHLWKRNAEKGAALEAFLCSVCEHQRGRLGMFVETAVMNSLLYRERAGNPLSRNELDELNDLLSRLGVEVKSLVAPKFRHSLPDLSLDEEAREQRRRATLERLRGDYLKLEKKEDPDDRGHAFERLLTGVLKLSKLRIVRRLTNEGPTVRGRFRLDYHVVLLRARAGEPVGLSEFDAFRAETRQHAHTLGLVLSVNGFSAEAVQAAGDDTGPNYFMMDGAHLFRILNGDIPFHELMGKLVIRLAERRQPYVPIGALLTPG